MTLDDRALRSGVTPAPPVPTDPEPPRTRWWQRPHPRWVTAAVVLLVAGGIALRFVSVGPLWLDEAQSVYIAHQPLTDIPHQLRSDGAPPLWYFLLHWWMQAFGDGTFTVRLLAIIPGILAIPVAGWLGSRLGGRQVGRLSMVLLAVMPFAIRYSVETRMYSLLLLLSLLGAHALLSLHRSQRPWPWAVAFFACATALLYTHYYSLWLGVIVGIGELYALLVRRDRRAAWAVGSLVAAAAAFVPWLPTLLFQAGHTGAPWDSAAGINDILGVVSSWAGGTTAASQIAALLMLFLALVAVLGRRGTTRTLVLGPPASPSSLRLLGVCVGVVLLAVVEAIVSRQAFVARYTSVVVGLFVVLVATGLATIPSTRWRRLGVAFFGVSGLVIGAVAVAQPRTEAGSAATGIEQTVQAGDIVFYCPDQLGPSVSRLLSGTPGLRQYTYPDFAPPGRVNWIDWAQRQELSNPNAVARRLASMVGGHTLWFVWSPAFRDAGPQCAALDADLTTDISAPYVDVPRHASMPEAMSVYTFQLPQVGSRGAAADGAEADR